MADTLHIDLVPLSLLGFCFTENLWALLDSPDVRGQDRRIPGTPGVRTKPRRADLTTVRLELLVEGETNAAGFPHIDHHRGLQLNQLYLKALVAPVPGTPATTRTATLVLDAGVTLTGTVHVDKLTFGEGAYTCPAVLTVSIPAGALT